MFSGAGAWNRRIGRAGGKFIASRGGTDAWIFFCATAETRGRLLELSHEPEVIPSVLRLPAHAERDRTQIGSNAVVRTMQDAEFPVNFNIRSNHVRDAAAEIFSEFVDAFRQKIAV